MRQQLHRPRQSPLCPVVDWSDPGCNRRQFSPVCPRRAKYTTSGVLPGCLHDRFLSSSDGVVQITHLWTLAGVGPTPATCRAQGTTNSPRLKRARDFPRASSPAVTQAWNMQLGEGTPRGLIPSPDIPICRSSMLRAGSNLARADPRDRATGGSAISGLSGQPSLPAWNRIP